VSAEIVIRADIRTCDDMIDTIQKWLPTAEPFERQKFWAFVQGFAESIPNNEREEDHDHSLGS
jgi:hypothetical protein